MIFHTFVTIYPPNYLLNKFWIFSIFDYFLLPSGDVLIKFSYFQRSLLDCSISDPYVLATRGAYIFIFSLCGLFSVCNVFDTPRAGPQSRPLPLVLYQTALYCTMLYFSVLYGSTPYNTLMYCLSRLVQYIGTMY